MVPRVFLTAPSIITTLSHTDSTNTCFYLISSTGQREHLGKLHELDEYKVVFPLMLSPSPTICLSGTSGAKDVCRSLVIISECFSLASWTHVSRCHSQFHLIYSLLWSPYACMYTLHALRDQNPGTHDRVIQRFMLWHKNILEVLFLSPLFISLVSTTVFVLFLVKFLMLCFLLQNTDLEISRFSIQGGSKDAGKYPRFIFSLCFLGRFQCSLFSLMRIRRSHNRLLFLLLYCFK